jgi:hypothetical protein
MSKEMMRGSGAGGTGGLDEGVGGGRSCAEDGGGEELDVILECVDEGVVTEDGGRVQCGEDRDGAAKDLVWAAVRVHGRFVGDAGVEMKAVEVDRGIGSKKQDEEGVGWMGREDLV